MSAGFHSANFLTVPSLTYSRIWFGRPRPVICTLPLKFDDETYREADAMPTVVGETITFRFGYDCSRPCASWKDFWSSSLPYATLTSLSLLYSGFVSSSFMIAIQAFWLVAFGVADSTAISPAPPDCSSAIFASDWPMPSVVAWLMNASRQSLLASESKVTTLIFAARAWL